MSLALAACLASGPCAAAPPDGGTFAAISIAARRDASVRVVIGEVTKHPANPLFTRDQPWESRIDNGYTSVVPPSEEGGEWKCWYNAFTQKADAREAKGSLLGEAQSTLLFANSSDGLRWAKPHLGLVPGIGNGVMEAFGAGVYGHRGRYYAFGQLKVDTRTPDAPRTSLRDNVAVSDDGLVFGNASSTPWPYPIGHGVGDCFDNLFFDDRRGRWLATTRATQDFTREQMRMPDGSCYATDLGAACSGVGPKGTNGAPGGRMIALLPSPGSAFAFDGSTKPVVTMPSQPSRQLYSQVTFQWHNVYLGLVMVIDQCDQLPNGTSDCHASEFGLGKVHCRLAYAVDPLVANTACKLEGTCVTHGKRHACNHCATGTANSTHTGWRFVDEGGLEGRDFIPLGHVGSGPSDPANAFDSHIIFAAASPVTVGDLTRIYYMAGDGPHSGDRNSSFALATMRKDGYAALAGSGVVMTTAIPCSAASLTVTVDFEEGAQAPSLSVNGSQSLTTNGTDMVVPGLNLAAYVGKSVVLELVLQEAKVYTIGFRRSRATPKTPSRSPDRVKKPPDTSSSSRATVGDRLWMWGTPSGFKNLWATQANATGGRPTRITAAEAAQYMGVHNTFMFWENTSATSCLAGAPDARVCDRFLAAPAHGNVTEAFRAYSVPLRPMAQVVWGASGAPALAGETYPAWVRPAELELASATRNVVGVALDDYPYDNFTDLLDVRAQLQRAAAASRARFPGKPALDLYTTFYTKDLNASGIESFLAHIEHPILWSWAAADMQHVMEAGGWFDSFEAVSGSGRMLGLYAYDFSEKGGGRLFPLDVMRAQLEWALQMLRSQRVYGVAFEGLFDLDLEAAEMLRDWIREVRDTPL